MPQYTEEGHDGPTCSYYLCPRGVDEEGARCNEHVVVETSPETKEEQEAKVERLERLRSDMEDAIDELGVPDNTHLQAALEKVELTLEKVDRPVSQRFRYGTPKDSSPRVAEYEVDELDEPDCEHSEWSARYVGDAQDDHEWVRECAECGESVTVVYDGDGGKGMDDPDKGNDDESWNTLT